MAQCIRCNRHFREPWGEKGDHSCPYCGLSPESRAEYTYTREHGWMPDSEPEDDEEVFAARYTTQYKKKP